METSIDIEEVLKNMRETIGAMAQENAILKATIAKLQSAES